MLFRNRKVDQNIIILAQLDPRYRAYAKKLGLTTSSTENTGINSVRDAAQTLFNTIKEKKMTLPLIYALNKAERAEKRKIINIMKHHNEEPDHVAEVISYVHKSGGIEYAREKMYAYREQALTILNAFPENAARNSLHDLLIFTTERTK